MRRPVMTEVLKTSREALKRAKVNGKPKSGKYASESMKSNGLEAGLEAISVVKSNGVTTGRVAAGGEHLDQRELLGALTALKKGDFSVRLPVGMDGLDGK